MKKEGLNPMTMEQAQSGQWLEGIWQKAEQKWAQIESEVGGIAQAAKRSELYRFSNVQELCVPEATQKSTARSGLGKKQASALQKPPAGIFLGDFESLKKDPNLQRILKFQGVAENLATLNFDLPALSILKAKPKTFFIDVVEASASVCFLSEVLSERQGIEHLLVSVASGQSVTIVDDLSDTDRKYQLLQAQVNEGAHLTWFTLVQPHENHIQAFSLRQVFSVEKNARLSFYPLLMGRNAHLEDAVEVLSANPKLQSQFGQLRSEVLLKGHESLVETKGVLEGEFQEKTDFILNVHHKSPHSKSSTNVWSVMADQSRGCFHGTIFIEENSYQVEAHQRTKSLTLSSQAEVVMLPKLEISCDDVKCSHGASVASVSDDQLHYLRSRGLDAEQARAMIIEGFTRPVLEMVPRGKVRDALFKELYGEVGAKGGEELW